MTTQWLWSFSSDWYWQIRLISIIARTLSAIIVSRIYVSILFFYKQRLVFDSRMIRTCHDGKRSRPYISTRPPSMSVDVTRYHSACYIFSFNLRAIPMLSYNDDEETLVHSCMETILAGVRARAHTPSPLNHHGISAMSRAVPFERSVIAIVANRATNIERWPVRG